MSKTLDPEPWRALPPEVTRAIEHAVPLVRDEILTVIAAEVPDYARPLEGPFGAGIRRGVDEALRQFIELVEDPDRGRGRGREVYVALGRGELRAGRSLDALQAAYRVGARVAWRRVADAAIEAGFGTDVVSALADAIFAYIDELAADSVEGYAEAQQAAAGERERLRRRLAALVLAEAVDEVAVRSAAAEAGWRVPERIGVVATEPAGLDALTRAAPSDALGAILEETGCVVVPDPDGPGRLTGLERAGVDAVLGPAGALADVRGAWERARSGLTAVRAGTLPGGFSRVGDHLAALALFEARDSVRDLAGARLAPLDPLTPAARARMLETLRAYLDQGGSAPAMARTLHLHPQTIRYRMRRLRELMGEALDDPDARFELSMALRAAGG